MAGQNAELSNVGDGGGSVTYKCKEGFKFSDGTLSINITCQNGQWSSAFSDCIGKYYKYYMMHNL